MTRKEFEKIVFQFLPNVPVVIVEKLVDWIILVREQIPKEE